MRYAFWYFVLMWGWRFRFGCRVCLALFFIFEFSFLPSVAFVTVGLRSVSRGELVRDSISRSQLLRFHPF